MGFRTATIHDVGFQLRHTVTIRNEKHAGAIDGSIRWRHPVTERDMEEDKARILVVDDEAELGALLSRYLGTRGYQVRHCLSTAEADRLLGRERFDLMVLDLMLPGEDGLSFCARLRARGETIPVLMLTARGDAIDRIVGLEMGADDYLPKPFEPRELLARLEAMLRRQRMLGAQIHTRPPADLRFGPFRLDTVTRRVLRDDAPVDISSGEFELLRALAANAGRALSRDRLIELVHGGGRELTERAIDVQILRLRRVLEDDPAQPRLILTVRGKGYMLAAEAPCD
ncbi:response regulator [Nitrogeniibacter aestuarii]|uniref:response regulator n=1 Tax=Nitrogeniibacter aestuarii TaxID=2815343 RepID=UPI001E52CD83|nr:response regulator [Nitrogeniibacter aestuarii]